MLDLIIGPSYEDVYSIWKYLNKMIPAFNVDLAGDLSMVG
jgi:hypothetical protein